MSLSKNEFEYLRLHAQKCDHRLMAPAASFDLAADLRANRGRGGKMFEKRKQRSDKYIFEDSDPNQVPGQDSGYVGPKLFASDAHPAIWSPASSKTPKRPNHIDFTDHVNRNHTSGDVEDTLDNLPDDERLRKLYKILHYSPPEDLMKIQPAKAPKVDLRSSSASRVPAVQGRNFNRNAKGWCADDDGSFHQTANPASNAAHPSGLLAVDVDYLDYSPTYAGPQTQGPFLHGESKPRPKSWHAVTMTLEDIRSEDEVIPGDYNPRPKAWHPAVYDADDLGQQEVLQFGDYNLKPKPWASNENEELLSPRSDVQFGDYNPRPKAWPSKQRKGRSKTRQGDFNPRPRAWQSSERRHFHPPRDTERQGDVKFRDYNARPKAWKSTGSDHFSITQGGRLRYLDYSTRRQVLEALVRKSRSSRSLSKVRYADYNARPQAWRSAPDDDSSSTTSSYTSEYSDDEYSYASTPYSPGSIPACDV